MSNSFQDQYHHDYNHNHNHQHHYHHHHSHDHSDDVGLVPVSEKIILVSCGIDIGSSTSHLMFARLELRRQGTALSSGFSVVKREVLYRSPVLLTPYRVADVIDVEQLQTFIDDCYEQAGLARTDIHTGAVIITGEAAKKQNADQIVHFFARSSGHFVCATAGPLLEARLAAYGSGAVQFSRGSEKKQVLNVDIGGGTTKISLVQDGQIVSVMVINVGARLLAWDARGCITRVEKAGEQSAQYCGLPVSVGLQIDEQTRKEVADCLIECLFEYLTGGMLFDLAKELFVSGEIFCPPPDAVLVFSGGVSEYVYGLEECDYGDMGPVMGSLIKEKLTAPSNRFQVVKGTDQLRATVIGASQYTVQVSGSTIFLSNQDILPLNNLPVIHVRLAGETSNSDLIAQSIVTAINCYGLESLPEKGILALAFHNRINVSYGQLRSLAEGIRQARTDLGLAGIVIILEQDIAGALGHILNEELVQENVFCVDQVVTGELDFVDVGQLLEDAGAVPLVVKSLVFA